MSTLLRDPFSPGYVIFSPLPASFLYLFSIHWVCADRLKSHRSHRLTARTFCAPSATRRAYPYKYYIACATGHDVSAGDLPRNLPIMEDDNRGIYLTQNIDGKRSTNSLQQIRRYNFHNSDRNDTGIACS